MTFVSYAAILLLGEPAHWETPLQLIIDMLLSNGRPNAKSERALVQTLPVIACNKDLQYMHRAVHPRYIGVYYKRTYKNCKMVLCSC